MVITTKNYCNILETASKNFKFIKFDEKFNENDKVILWRHDIDISPQRALFMAKKEAEFGIQGYYFVQVTSIFYNVLEQRISEIIQEISSLGHIIGVHFDASIYDGKSLSQIESKLKFEANILKNIINNEIDIFSIHNPTTLKNFESDNLNYFGFFNASSSELYKKYTYCSDSNGYWRYETLENLILNNNTKKLYVLTHPVWWQEIDMPPREKILRSILGRSNYSIKYYDNLLKINNRKNIS